MERRPYITDAEGNSLTRDFVERFLEQYASPVSETFTTAQGKVETTKSRSVFDTLFYPAPVPQVPLYKQGTKDPTKTYLGRAAKVSSSRNPHEFLWCIKADLSQVISRLDIHLKKALFCKYILDLYDAEAVVYFPKSEGYISTTTYKRYVDAALDAISEGLDYGI